MEVKQLLKSKLYKASAILGLSLLSYTNVTAQANVTVDTSDEWLAAMVWFNNDAQQAFVGYAGDWPLAALKTTINTTNNTISLYPNYNAYADNPGNPVWVNGNTGNKIMLAISYTEADDMLNQNFTFSGKVVSNTLVAGYTVQAFIKVMDASYAVTIDEITANLDEEGNFTIPCTNWAAYMAAGAAHVQYGFMTRGLNANPTAEATNGFMVVTSDEPQTPPAPEAVQVSLDATDAASIIGYANWFQLDGTSYIGGGTYGLNDLKTVVNANSNTLVLYPNFFAFSSGPEWSNGNVGTRVFEGNTYIEDNTLLGENVTFSGHCQSNTLATGYKARAFIKVLSASYDLLNYTPVELEGGENFSLTVDIAQFPAGAHVQYGYSVTGVNANPTQEAALGNAVVTSATASTAAFTKNSVVMYPNPATSVLNISAENNIDTVEIYNLLGQKVIDAKPAQNAAAVNVSNLTSGVYIVNTTVAGKQTSARFVKQ